MKKVLIIDDNFGTALTTKISFDRNGLSADYCQSAKEAKEKLSKNSYDYIVADIIINGDNENGLFLCKFIKNTKPDVKFLFITGCNPDSIYAEEAAKMAPVVFKEFSPKALAKDIIDGKYD